MVAYQKLKTIEKSPALKVVVVSYKRGWLFDEKFWLKWFDWKQIWCSEKVVANKKGVPGGGGAEGIPT